MTPEASVTVGAKIATRLVDVERPWLWLSAGWRDLWRAPQVSLCYGLVFVVISFLLTLGLWLAGLLYLLLPLAAGFMFLGPIIAVGLYDVSRRLERGERPSLADAIGAWRGNGSQLALLGLVLMLFLLAWVRIAFLIFALFFGGQPPAWDLLVNTIFFTVDGIPFLAVGTVAGGVLALMVFAISAVAPPLLMDRDIGAMEAIFASVSAVTRNWRVMLGWGALIVLFMGAGLATFYVGLIVTLPLIGHASWHAYRDLIVAEGA
jgi:uncharacterized membrane protein